MATTARTTTVTVVNGFFMMSPSLTSVTITAQPACGPRISNRDMADIGQIISCPSELPVQLRPPSAKAKHMDGTVYKVMSRTAFAEAKAKGRFEGSADDRRDGFIHLSSADQLEGTLAKHFAGGKVLVVLAMDTTTLGERLCWEPSRGGDLFPQLYGPLPFEALIWEEPIELGTDGRHRLPARVLP